MFRRSYDSFIYGSMGAPGGVRQSDCQRACRDRKLTQNYHGGHHAKRE
jgi:hypothetical protein